jgi:hypothetical protein
MSNRVSEAFLKIGLPKRPDGKNYTSTAYCIYSVICYRYDERPLDKKGNPHRGYLKSYVGFQGFLKATGRSKSVVFNAIKELLEGGVLEQITDGKENNRAEFRPTYHLKQLGDNVLPTGHVKRNTGKRIQDDRVAPVALEGHVYRTTGSRPPDPISNTSTDKYDKYSINQERFNKVLNAIPKDNRIYIKAGTNYEVRLDKLERRGTTLEVTCAYLAKQNWSNAITNGGLLSNFLDALLGDTKARKSSPMKWCGYCDEATRTYDIPERDAEGRTYYECETCSPEGIRRKNLKKVTLDEKTDVLKTLGFPFGRSVDE